MSKIMRMMPLFLLCASIIAMPWAWANWVQDGVAICTATGDQNNPAIVSDGVGGAIIIWHTPLVSVGPRAQRVNASGEVQWMENGVGLAYNVYSIQNCAMTSDGAGGAIVVWDGWDNSFDIFAQWVDAAGEAHWEPDRFGLHITWTAGSQINPQLASDDTGNAIVAWQDYRSGNYDIYAQRVDTSGAVHWTTDGIPICAATGDQVAAKLVSDGAGGAIVAWMDYCEGEDYDIYAQRVNATGAVQWTSDGIPLCTAQENREQLTIISDGVGGAIVAWMDYRGGEDYDIYAQRVNASGAVQWTSDGIPLCTAPGNQSALTMTSDGAGGAIVAWSVYSSGDFDIYAQRVNASGTVQWTANGVPLCTATGGRDLPVIVSDGAGGAIVTWQDGRSGDADIYAQRVNVSGAVQWMVDGIPLCTATISQNEPAITSDGAGGAIVAWLDTRSGTSVDIYGMRVDANGFPVLTTANAPPPPVKLYQNYPNPFNPATTVAYSIPERWSVTLEIYDVSGKRIALLVEGLKERGFHKAEWNGKDAEGRLVASGIYLCKLSAGNQTVSRKMVLLR